MREIYIEVQELNKEFNGVDSILNAVLPLFNPVTPPVEEVRAKEIQQDELLEMMGLMVEKMERLEAFQSDITSRISSNITSIKTGTDFIVNRYTSSSKENNKPTSTKEERKLHIKSVLTTPRKCRTKV